MKKFLQPTFLGTNIEFENKYVRVRTDSIILHREVDGKIEDLHKEYFTADSENFVVGIVLKDNKLLTISQYRVPLRKFNTEFIAGTIEQNETPEQAIRKELLEEGGIKANNIRYLGQMNPLAGFNSTIGYFYLIDDFVEVDVQLEEYEKFTNLTKSWISIEDFRILLQSNKITDGVTLAAWALFREIIDIM